MKKSVFLNVKTLAARLERSSFCEEVRRAKKREWKAEKVPKKIIKNSFRRMSKWCPN